MIRGEVTVCLTCGTVGPCPTNGLPPRAGHWHTLATIDVRHIEETWTDADGRSVIAEALRVLEVRP